MATPYIGLIQAFAFPFPPVGWVLCNGQLLQIAQYDALYSLIGTTYGGDGVSTFGVPDLRGRSPLGIGTGPGLSNYVLGQMTGTESVQLQLGQLPAHNHILGATTTPASTNNPNGAILASTDIWTDVAVDSSMANSVVQNTGNNQAHENRQPSLVINFCMATEGIYPSQG